jgi:cell shape-determining protein MreC
MKGEHVTYVEQLREQQARQAAAPKREYLSKEEYAQLKSALTSAKKSGDGSKVLAVVEHAVKRFNETIWPDDWSSWRIALDDAASDARYKHGNHALAEELHAASMVLF